VGVRTTNLAWSRAVQTDDTQERQWRRQETVAHVAAFEATAGGAMTQREYARGHDVPRTTLQHWLARKGSLDASPTLVAWFESSEGLAFLHRLVIAVQFGMTYFSVGGLRAVAKVMELAGLEPFIANSFGSRQKLGTRMEGQIRAFAEEQRASLGAQMASKRITVCEDETFHPAVCLVAMEPVSNFILLETYAQRRDEESWNAALKGALGDLPVQVIQSTSDEGKGLLAHVRKGLGAHHSPDVFHVQHELCRAVSAGLSAQVRRAEQSVTQAQAEAEAHRQEAQAWPLVPHGPGRPPDFAGRVAAAQGALEQKEQALAAARERQERAHRAVRGLAKVYHPFELDTGSPRSAAQAVTELEQHFATLQAVAQEASLPERCHKGIEKAHRLVPAMGGTLAFFHQQGQALIGELGLPPQQARIVEQALVPAAYLERAAAKARPAVARAALRDQVDRIRNTPHVTACLAALRPEQRAAVEAVVTDCADLFQRASSCVEGRNGQLSLRHHSLHNIAPTPLDALTAVHNYFLRRPDGTTAAQRFFGAPPADLFGFLLDHLDMPARPAAKRSQHAAAPMPN
jgi:hypothetical protein